MPRRRPLPRQRWETVCPAIHPYARQAFKPCTEVGLAPSSWHTAGAPASYFAQVSPEHDAPLYLLEVLCKFIELGAGDRHELTKVHLDVRLSRLSCDLSLLRAVELSHTPMS